MTSRCIPAVVVLCSVLGLAVGGCAPKTTTASTLTEKDRATFKGGPMPASARQEMAEWIKKSQAKHKPTSGAAPTGPTAAEQAAAAMK